MTGLAGGSVDAASLANMLDSMRHEESYEEARFGRGDAGLGVLHHGSVDPGGVTIWDGDSRAGVVDGAITNRGALSLETDELFEAVLDRPDTVLPRIEGPFVLCAVDWSDKRFVLAQDKIGTRPCYYTTDGEFLFASELKALVPRQSSPELNLQAASDLLLMGYMWGDKTLVEGIRSLRPATYLECVDGDYTTTRYWKPSYEEADPGDPYLYELLKRTERSIDRVAGTLSGSAGLWLSGGIDSRVTACALRRSLDRRDAAGTHATDGSGVAAGVQHAARDAVDATGATDLVAYTYDANPPGPNPDLARRVADSLDIPNTEVELSAERFAPHLETVIERTDGMVQWNTLKNLSAVFNIDAPAGVVMEGLEGTLFGHHVERHHLRDCSSAVESMYRSEASLDESTVRDLLTPSVDPLDSFREEVRWCDEQSLRGRVLDAHFQNYYLRCAHASNQIPRSRVGTRVVYADGPLIEAAASLPTRYRMGALPLTRNRIPHGVTYPKLRLVRGLDANLARIPYERTGVPPSYPFPLHVAGFVGTTGLARLRDRTTYGGRGLVDEWYRTNESLRETVNGLLEAACDRALFDDGVVRDVQAAHLAGDANNTKIIAPLTTLEHWLQVTLD